MKYIFTYFRRQSEYCFDIWSAGGLEARAGVQISGKSKALQDMGSYGRPDTRNVT